MRQKNFQRQQNMPARGALVAKSLEVHIITMEEDYLNSIKMLEKKTENK